jgi:hypothetical protein
MSIFWQFAQGYGDLMIAGAVLLVALLAFIFSRGKLSAGGGMVLLLAALGGIAGMAYLGSKRQDKLKAEIAKLKKDIVAKEAEVAAAANASAESLSKYQELKAESENRRQVYEKELARIEGEKTAALAAVKDQTPRETGKTLLDLYRGRN